MGTRGLSTEKWQEPEADCCLYLVPKLRWCGILFPLPHISFWHEVKHRDTWFCVSALEGSQFVIPSDVTSLQLEVLNLLIFITV
jgi:hypothetical protein